MPGPERSDGNPSAVSAAEARAQVEAQREARRAEKQRRLDEAFPGVLPGRWIIRASWLATALQSAVSALAVVDPDRFLGVFFGVTMALFLLGSVLFVVDIVLAAARSTTDAMGIGGLFFLAGSAPRAAALPLNASLGVVVAVAVAAALAGLSSPELAFGTLSPMLQLSLSGLWGVRHGLFEPRGDTDG